MNSKSDFSTISQIISSHSEQVVSKYKNEDLIKEKFDVSNDISFKDFFARL